MAGKGARKGTNSAQSSGHQRKPPPGKPFKKGESGNPGGLPQWRRDLADALKESAQAGANLLDHVIRDEDTDMQHRIQAAAVALRFTVPAPKQRVELSGSVAALAELDADALLKLAQGE